MRFGLACLSVAVLCAAFLACSSDPDPAAPSAAGGSTGSGGSAGASGGSGGATGGVTGSGGSTGGSGGSGGATGGSAGLGGSGGSGGGNGTPTKLSETGLFTDITAETLAPGVREYAPQFQLWSDGATKRRWVYLPEGTTIDTSNMDYWSYPVGTKLWKEFTRGSTRVETRMIEKTGTGDSDWFMMAFKWNDDGNDADAVPEGEMNAKGTNHDIPDEFTCWECHGNMKGRVLGFSALQLSHNNAGVKLTDLISEGLLSDPPAGNFTVPGTADEQAMLGYFHANCGLCHNDGGKSEPFVTIDMELWLHTADLAGNVDQTNTYLTTIDQATQASSGPQGTRVIPDDFATSVLYERFTSTNVDDRMPPVGTEDIDPTGKAAIEAWIDGLVP